MTPSLRKQRHTATQVILSGVNRGLCRDFRAQRWVFNFYDGGFN